MTRIFILVLFLWIGTLSAQISRNDSRINDAFTDLTNRIKPSSTNFGNTNFKGSPYFDTAFNEATLVYFGKPLEEQVYLRYNAFADEMEMSLNSFATSTDQVLIKNSKVICKIQGEVFRYLPLTNGNSTLGKMGYVREVYKGQHYSLYLRERKIFREGKKARTSLERSFPARFVDESEWYFQKKEGPLEFIKPNKKNFKKYFKTDLVHLETFLKTKKGDMKKMEYLKKLLRFMDEVK